MSISRALYYYSGGAYQDISDYVLDISKFSYGISDIDKGNAIKFKVVLDTNCPYYGTTNKWKLTIGSDYILLGAPHDGIEDIGGYRLEVTLIDWFFVSMYKKTPLKITGDGGDASSIAGEAITVKTIKDILVPYTTNQEDFDADGFSSRDDTNFYDGLGNTITITGGKTDIRYKTKGALRGLDQTADLGQCYVNIRDILNNIAVAEGFTLDVDFGNTESSQYGNCTGASTYNVKKIWDVKVINGWVIYLLSYTGGDVYLVSMDIEASGSTGGTDSLSWDSRDWAEGNSGEDWVVYQIFPDYRNNCLYIPGFYCSSYNPAAGTNQYNFMVKKISVALDGSLTEEYSDTYDAADVAVIDSDPSYRSGLQSREERFDPTLINYDLAKFNCKTWYTDANLASSNKFRIIMLHDGDIYIIDPDRYHNSLSNSIYKHTSLPSGVSWHGIVPDWMNGTVILIYESSSNVYEKHLYRANMDTLTAAYCLDSPGGRIHADDDPLNNTGHSRGVWRESFVYNDTIPSATGDFYYFLPQVPNGHLVREGVYNNYIELKDDYLSNHYSHDVTYGGSAWDDSIDRALVWHTDADEDPDYLYWDVHDYYTYKRLYLYQPYIYENRTEQFLDALVSHGFFYEQRNGNVRLVRINGNGTNIGTFTDTNLLNKITLEGFTDFGQQYVLMVLNSQKTKESGNQSKDLKTTISEYGWFSMWQLDYYSDWTYQINNDQTGLEIIADLERFNDVASTRYPLIGDEFTYSGTTYIILKPEIDYINWIINVIGIEDAS